MAIRGMGKSEKRIPSSAPALHAWRWSERGRCFSLFPGSFEFNHESAASISLLPSDFDTALREKARRAGPAQTNHRLRRLGGET